MGSDVRTSDLNVKAAPVDTDLFMIVDVEDTSMATSGTNKKSTFSDVAAAIAGILGLGTAAEKAASAASLPTLASVASGTITPGHLAAFADGAGTIEDGGPIPPSTAPAPIRTVMAGPQSGGPALPTMRLLGPADIPAIPEAGVTNLPADLATLSAGVAAAALDSAVLHKSANLGDVASVTAARGNLGLGTAATKAASSGTAAAVASVGPGPFTAGHVAILADGAGTIEDGGAPYAAGMTQPMHAVMAGPVSGPAALPAFRGLDPTDIPAIPESGVTGLVGDLAALQAGVSAAAVDSAVLHKSANLADLADLAAARGNLGLGTAAVKGASSAAAAAVASVNGATVVGHMATFSDTSGTIADGGAPPTPTAPQSANAVYAGPGSGAAALPAFRPLVAADVPPIPEAGVINLVNDLANLNAGVAAAAVDSAVLHKSANLGDVSNVAAARGNLGLGTAATRAASGGGGVVASVAGSFVVGHMATFSDAAGTIADGGAPPTPAAAQPANAIYAGPGSGAAAVPTFRALVPADVPTIPASGVSGLGTASTKAASSGTAAAVASVGAGPFVAGHMAIYSDTAGTITDGGPPPAAPAAQPANAVYAGPASGGSTVPAFRALVPADIPTIPASGVSGLGTAAMKAASSGGAGTVASVVGATVAGHLATFADTGGTVTDGGAPPVPLVPAGSAGNVQFNKGDGTLSAVVGVGTGTGVLLNLFAQNAGDIPLQIRGAAGQTAPIQTWGFAAGAITSIDRYGRPAFAQPNVATVTAGPAAGPGATVVTSGNEIAGAVTVTPGTAPVASAAIATITYKNPLASAPCAINITPLNAYAATLALNGAYMWADWSGTGTTAFRIMISGTGTMTASQPHSFAYRVHL